MRRNDRSASTRRMIVVLPAALLTFALGACGNGGTTVATPTTPPPSTSGPVGTDSPTSRPSSRKTATTSPRTKVQSSKPRTHRRSSTTTTPAPHRAPTSSPTSTAPKAPAVPARFGPMTSGEHHTVDVSGKGDAMTVRFDDLEVGLADPDLSASRTWTVDLPLTGAVAGHSLRVTVSGYAFTADDVSATLTISACGHQQSATYEPGSDDEYVLAVPSIALTAGLTRCHVVVTIDVVQSRASTESSDGYLNVAALDVELV